MAKPVSGVKSTKRQFLVTVEGADKGKGIPGKWRISSGGGISAEVTKDYSGGSHKPDLLGGLPQAEDMELTRTFEPFRDLEVIKSLRSKVGRTWYNITKQPTDANFGVFDSSTITYRALLIGVSEVDSDAGSSDAAEFTLKFATNGAS